MTRAIRWVKALASALVLAGLAPSTAAVKVAPSTAGYALSDSPAQTLVATRAGTYTAIGKPETPVVERQPNSRLAWEFDHEADGTAAIKGPSGTIWRGKLQVGMGPINPSKPDAYTPDYNITVPGFWPGGSRIFQSKPLSIPPAPSMPAPNAPAETLTFCRPSE